ncbi:hypothetical protein GGQ86_003454 [Xanthobacter flavus]|uniref:Uncharacterized protein n=1 Tax=Xanthobacter flavus TaxID=281 RepID=A0ABU1KK49_XANFL|nr:hypothetical protein [Xanthobacter flavus]MDR6334964.1 hypothetical protein [Xanthobacter flavus]
MVVIAGLAFLAIYVLHIPFPLIILAAGAPCSGSSSGCTPRSRYAAWRGWCSQRWAR